MIFLPFKNFQETLNVKVITLFETKISEIYTYSDLHVLIRNKNFMILISLYKSNRMFFYVFVYLCVPNDLANRWTNMVLLYNSASRRPGKVYNNFGGVISYRKNASSNILYLFFLKLAGVDTLHSNLEYP